MPLTPHDRKNREHQGEAHVRFRFAANGLNSPERDLDREWLTEIDEARRKRTEELQTDQTRFNKSTRLAAWIAAYAAIAGIIVPLVIWYAQDRMAKAEVAHNRMIKDSIGRYIKLGDAIMNDFAQNKWPVVEENDWVGDVKRFLLVNLNDSYVSRFEDPSGIQPVTIRPSADIQHDNEYKYMYFRITRLQEFSHELP